MRITTRMFFSAMCCCAAGGCAGKEDIGDFHRGNLKLKLAFISSHSGAYTSWCGGNSKILEELYLHMENDAVEQLGDPMDTGTALPIPQYTVLFALENGEYVEACFDASLKFVCFSSDKRYPKYLKYNEELEHKVSGLIEQFASADPIARQGM